MQHLIELINDFICGVHDQSDYNFTHIMHAFVVEPVELNNDEVTELIQMGHMTNEDSIILERTLIKLASDVTSVFTNAEKYGGSKKVIGYELEKVFKKHNFSKEFSDYLKFQLLSSYDDNSRKRY